MAARLYKARRAGCKGVSPWLVAGGHFPGCAGYACPSAQGSKGAETPLVEAAAETAVGVQGRSALAGSTGVEPLAGGCNGGMEYTPCQASPTERLGVVRGTRTWLAHALISEYHGNP